MFSTVLPHNSDPHLTTSGNCSATISRSHIDCCENREKNPPLPLHFSFLSAIIYTAHILPHSFQGLFPKCHFMITTRDRQEVAGDTPTDTPNRRVERRAERCGAPITTHLWSIDKHILRFATRQGLRVCVCACVFQMHRD